MPLEKITTSTNSGSMILFDGTSCAGKTSICKLLSHNVPTSYHYIALDDFITDVFEEQKQNPLPFNEFIATCNKRTESMYVHIGTMVHRGNNVLCDTTLTCLEDTTSTYRWFKIIKNINNVMILVYCPFDAVVKRLQQRNHHARIQNQPRNSRITSVVLRQFHAMFKAHRDKTEFTIDELSRANVDRAFELVRDDFADAQEFESLRKEIFKKFGLHNRNKVFIAPRLSYDYVINTHHYPVEDCVKIIFEHLRQN